MISSPAVREAHYSQLIMFNKRLVNFFHGDGSSWKWRDVHIMVSWAFCDSTSCELFPSERDMPTLPQLPWVQWRKIAGWETNAKTLGLFSVLEASWIYNQPVLCLTLVTPHSLLERCLSPVLNCSLPNASWCFPPGHFSCPNTLPRDGSIRASLVVISTPGICSHYSAHYLCFTSLQ